MRVRRSRRRKTTKANVFIIESLDSIDEKEKRFEGQILSRILRLGGKQSRYYYIRTKKELKKALESFGESGYRYLHLSCHGNETSISTTRDTIRFSELNRLMKPYLKDKRLFISSCNAVNDDLAATVIPSSKCFSIVGPAEEIDFADAAIIYASFYHLMFRKDPRKMRRRNILSTLRNVAKTFRVNMNYFSISKTSERGYKGIPIPGSKRLSRIRKHKLQ